MKRMSDIATVTCIQATKEEKQIYNRRRLNTIPPAVVVAEIIKKGKIV